VDELALAFAVVDAPWGPVHVAAGPGGLVAVEHLATTERFVARLGRQFGATVRPAGPGADPAASLLAETAADQLSAYLAGRRRVFDLPVHLAGRSAWDRAVLAGVTAVPWGAVTSYGRVARRIGHHGAARAVGGAVGRNPIGIVIPCHRVVASDGSLGGYGGDWLGSREILLEIKRELLRLESVTLPVSELFD